MKQWEDPNHFMKWSVFEREARMNQENDMAIFGYYHTEQDADEARKKYFGANNDNYYIKQHDSRFP